MLSNAGTTHLLVGATATFSCCSDHQSQLGHTFTNDSTITVTSGQIRLCDGSVLQNNGTLILNGTNAVLSGCGGTVNNPATGIITKTAASTGPSPFATLNNAGTINANVGSVSRPEQEPRAVPTTWAATTLTVPNSRTFSAGSTINRKHDQHRRRRPGGTIDFGALNSFTNLTITRQATTTVNATITNIDELFQGVLKGNQDVTNTLAS